MREEPIDERLTLPVFPPHKPSPTAPVTIPPLSSASASALPVVSLPPPAVPALRPPDATSSAPAPSLTAAGHSQGWDLEDDEPTSSVPVPELPAATEPPVDASVAVTTSEAATPPAMAAPIHMITIDGSSPTSAANEPRMVAPLMPVDIQQPAVEIPAAEVFSIPRTVRSRLPEFHIGQVPLRRLGFGAVLAVLLITALAFQGGIFTPEESVLPAAQEVAQSPAREEEPALLAAASTSTPPPAGAPVEPALPEDPSTTILTAALPGDPPPTTLTVAPRPKAAAPSARTAQKRLAARAQACRKKHHAVRGPKIVVRYEINPSGRTTRPQTSATGPLGKCLVEAVKKTRFPQKRATGQKVSL